jgi:acetyl esterase/lipase
MKIQSLALLGLLGVGCSSGGTDTETLVGACGPSEPASCAYEPEQLYRPGGKMARDIVYTDITGKERTVRIELRVPMGAPEPSPVIVWSHGGSARNTAANVGVEWGEVFNRAGFVVIALAHEGRGAEATQALCVALNLGDCELVSCTQGEVCARGTAPDEEFGTCEVDQALGGGYCRYIKNLHWDRPNDFREVLDWVEAEAIGGMLDGVVDTSRIAYAGHSAGAGSTMMVAGAARPLRENAEDRLVMDTRPIAFLSCSPQGPDDAGFSTASFTRERCEELAAQEDRVGCLTRPHLVLTGLGDGGDNAGENRRLSFDLAPVGERYMAYLTELAPQHTTFDYQTEGCERYARDKVLGSEFPERCNTYRLWIQSAALAFFDATLRDNPDAQAYLEADNMSVLSGAALEWSAK